MTPLDPANVSRCASCVARIWQETNGQNSGQIVLAIGEDRAASLADKALIEAELVSAITAQSIPPDRVFVATTEPLDIADGPFVLVSAIGTVLLSEDLKSRMVAVHNLNSSWEPTNTQGCRGYQGSFTDGSTLPGPFVEVVPEEIS